jgi:hypothetical protein
MGLTSTVFFGSKSPGTDCLNFENPPTLRATFLYSFPAATGYLSYVPRHWVHLVRHLSGTHNQVFCYCQTIAVLCTTKIRSHAATDGQAVSVSWCWGPSGAHDQMFLTVLSLWSTLSDERTGLPFVS